MVKATGLLLNFAIRCTVLLMLATAALYAQVDTGAVSGTVSDTSGAVIPGALVTLTNEGTSFSISKVVGSDGSYLFTPVKIGIYSLIVKYQGFETEVRPHVPVNIQQHVVLDFTLRPGAVTQTVQVTAAAALLQTKDASVGQVVGASEVNDLPLEAGIILFLPNSTQG